MSFIFHEKTAVRLMRVGFGMSLRTKRLSFLVRSVTRLRLRAAERSERFRYRSVPKTRPIRTEKDAVQKESGRKKKGVKRAPRNWSPYGCRFGSTFRPSNSRATMNRVAARRNFNSCATYRKIYLKKTVALEYRENYTF